MLRKIIFIFTFVIPVIAFAQPAPTDDCAQAPQLTAAQIINYCSNGSYTNASATESFTNSGPDVWFKFTAKKYDINISVSGIANGGIRSPIIRLYSDCSGNGLVGSLITGTSNSTFYKGGLKVDQTYFIQISSTNSNRGAFSICINNSSPTPRAGQDNITSSKLCSKETVTLQSAAGPGVNDDEAAGTCLDIPFQQITTEQNSVWYEWIAANNGSLTFTIAPTDTTDDIDWVLYDLGTPGNPTRIPLRCAAGRGVDCTSGPIYYKTGLDLLSDINEVNEAAGCGQGQNGFVSSINMIQGHSYSLLINNFSSANHGFTLSFGGTGEFLGPQSAFNYVVNQPCTPGQSYTFSSQATNHTRLVWRFGDGASLDSSALANPPTITYSTLGIKTVVLEAYNDKGCFVISSQSFTVGLKPPTPVIQSNKPRFCLGDTIILSTTPVPNTTYSWTGPNNFTSDQASVSIPVNSTNAGGTYTLLATVGNCTSDPATITIPAIPNNAVAAFTYVENQPCTPGQNYIFTSQSTGYSRLVWRFGSGANIDTSALASPPIITYSTPGMKTVVLEAYNAYDCVVIASQSFAVGVRPAAPVIQANKPEFCLGDTIMISTVPVPNTTYSWTGPNNFTSTQPSISIPVTSTNVSGIYRLTAIQGNCLSNPAVITVPTILNVPVAAFRTSPSMPAKLSLPVTVSFFNQSINADTYLWDFGDGSTSTDANPVHTYTTVGEYDITLTAFKSNVCAGSVTKGTFVINADNTLFIPNTFTPNGDGINDEFVVNISNLLHYKISIYNRWGTPMFAATSIFDNWTGTYNGERLPVSTYYYVIDAVGLNGNPIKKSGYITIVR